MVPGIDLYIVDLIRDSRGMAYSCLRRKLREDTGRYMGQYSTLESSLRWVIFNLQIVATSLTWPLLVRYKYPVRLNLLR